MTYTSDVPVFSSNNDDVFLIDSYSNTLLKFSDDEMMPYLTFDFGKYSIPDSFYKYNDPYESVFFLNDSNFALINRYWESDVYRLVEVFIQTKEDVSYKYALCSKNEWSWFSEDKNHEFFSNSFRAIRDKQLFCLVSPEKLCTIPEKLMDFGVDFSSLSTLSRESNYVVFTITLK